MVDVIYKLQKKVFQGGKFLLLLSVFSGVGCFDYFERIVFNPGFSGFVDIEYTVPLFPEKEESLIQFLPIKESAIRQKYSGIFTGKKSIQISNYSVEYRDSQDPLYPRQARVGFRVSFSNPEDLEKILLGNTTVYWRGKNLVVQRIFPSASSIPEKAGRIPARYGEMTEKSFQDRSLRFHVLYPDYYDFYTNRGTILRPGSIAYQIPLQRTVQSGASVFWNIELQANSKQKVEPDQKE